MVPRGVDRKKLLTWNPDKIFEDVKTISKLFKKGGLILSPSVEVTPDVPLGNIKSIYKFFK